MGHADIAATMIYVHHVSQHDTAAKLSTAVAQTSARGGLGVDPDRLSADVGYGPAWQDRARELCCLCAGPDR